MCFSTNGSFYTIKCTVIPSLASHRLLLEEINSVLGCDAV
jgi:hypothetical protein